MSEFLLPESPESITIQDEKFIVRQPLVSVCMITYNHAPYIAQAIEGVLQQETDFPVELVIGEDCSTDGTREIVFDYQKRYPETIRVVTSETNVGMWANSRRTHVACRGKYMTFCEGDDQWHHPKKIKKQVEYLESHPKCGLVHSDVDVLEVLTGERIHNRRMTLEVACKDDDLELSWWILSGQYPIWTCTVCARKNLVDDVYSANPEVFQEDRFKMGDLPLWFELSRLARVHYIDESLVTYRVLAESASRSRDICKQLRFLLSGRDVRLYYIDKYSCPPGMRRTILEARNRTLLSTAYEARDSQVAEDAASELRKLGVELTPYERMLLFGSHPLGSMFVRPIVFSKTLPTRIASRLRRMVCGNRSKSRFNSCGKDSQ